MKKLYYLLFLPTFFTLAQELIKPKVDKIATGTSFTCITLDRSNKLWVGSNKQGLWVSKDSIENNQAIKSLSLYTSDPNFVKNNIQSVTVSYSGTVPRIYVGHNGNATSTASGGGITVFNMGDATGKKLITEIDATFARGIGTKPAKNDGVPSRNCKAIAVDRNGSIWSAHGYHDLTVTGGDVVIVDPFTGIPTVYASGGYFLTPGGVGFLNAGNVVFDNVANGAIPYPLYTVNPPFDKTPGTRQCYSVACGPYETWVGGSAFNVSEGVVNYAGIHRFSFAGKYLGSFNYSNAAGLPFNNTLSSPIPMSLHFRKNGDAWVGFNKSLGFAVYKDAIYTTAHWEYISALKKYNKNTGADEVSSLLPNGIRLNINMPNIISSSGQRVFVGTQDGLLVYTGKGDYRQDSSYVLVTTANGLSSNNIKSVVAGNKYVYVVTDAGVDQVYIPGDLEIMHIVDATKPFDNISGENYVSIGTLVNKNDMQITYNNDDLPIIAADGSKATILRYYTNDFDAFYNSNKYVYGFNADYNKSDTSQFGKVELKPIDTYENSSKSYVDFIFRHPEYINPSKMTGNECVLRFSIGNKQNLSTEFQHDIKFSLPPVLLVHGVWTTIESLNKIREKLYQNGYKDYQVLRTWRKSMLAEESFMNVNKFIVPQYIDRLLKICENNGMSAGKVNVVVHSRGGLYTRGYIEELYGVKYRGDVHSLTTLNTPHSGSQLANLVLDARKVPVLGVAIGDIISMKGIMGEDKGPREGARQLMVNKGFIVDLNDPTRLEKLVTHKVPMHMIATKAELCGLKTSFCDVDVFDKLSFVPYFKVASKILSLLSHDLPKGADAFLKSVFEGEASDLIVPRSSMEVGLKGTSYVSNFEGLNLAHIQGGAFLGMPGVCESEEVLDKIVSLLKENVHNENSRFTTKGIHPPKLQYNFLKGWLGEPNFLKKANIDSNIFQIKYLPFSIKEGDSLKYAVRLNGNDHVFVTYQHEVLKGDSLYIEEKSVSGDTAKFAFKVPQNFTGRLLVVAYGQRDGKLVDVDSAWVQVNLKDGIQLTSLYFDGEKDVQLVQNQKMRYTVYGKFSDSLVRVINTLPSLKIVIEDTTIAKRIDENYIYAKTLKTGRTVIGASYGSYIDKLELTVMQNENLQKSLISYLSGTQTKQGVQIDWETSQEYKLSYFVLEALESGVSKFDSISRIDAQGTTLDLQTYYAMDFTSRPDGIMKYRLKLVDSLGTYRYSDTIFVRIGEVVTDVVSVEKSLSHEISMYPNPTDQQFVNLEFYSKSADQEARLSIVDMEGKEWLNQNLILKIGENVINKIDLSGIDPGMYILKIRSKNEIMTKKLLITID